MKALTFYQNKVAKEVRDIVSQDRAPEEVEKGMDLREAAAEAINISQADLGLTDMDISTISNIDSAIDSLIQLRRLLRFQDSLKDLPEETWAEKAPTKKELKAKDKEEALANAATTEKAPKTKKTKKVKTEEPAPVNPEAGPEPESE